MSATILPVIAASVLVLAVLAAIAIIKSLVHICQPNEALVISGGQRAMGGRTLGYRVVQGGRAIRLPLIEKVDRIDLSNIAIDISLHGAYSRGGIPLEVVGVANVKVASDEATMANAIERFLGKPREQLVALAKETLEGNLRGVLATLTPEEVNNDRVKFATHLMREAEGDLRRIGLVLDTLKIQNVSDERGYLDSIGRKQSAEVLMNSRIAEAENKAIAMQRSADNHEQQELARLDAWLQTETAEAERRCLEADALAEALVAEARAEVTAAIAKAEAELEVQQARVDQVKLQLTADRLRTAEARRDEQVQAARAACAPIVKNGKATAQALRQMADSWQRAGGDARQAFVAQNLDTLIGTVVDRVAKNPANKVTVVDPSLAAGDASLASKAVVAAEMLQKAGGIDLGQLLQAPRRDVG